MGFFSLSLLCASLLLQNTRAAPLVVEKRAVSQDVLNRLSFFEQYAAASYCPANNVASSDPAITCDVGNCPLVQSAGAQSLFEFQNQGAADSTGFVALDHTNQLIVISFRGTTSILNILADANFVLEPFTEACATCSAFSGFLDSWRAVRTKIQPVIASALASNPTYKVVATGHSLGAAIASLAAADLRKNAGYTVDLYTYGSPMPGNLALAQLITSQTTQNYRVTHAEDIVPKLPGYLLGYAHISPEYWITSAINVTVTANDIKVSTGNIDLKGNEGTLGNNANDHSWYFNAIASCGPGIGSEILR